MPQIKKKNIETRRVSREMYAQLYYGPQDVRYEQVKIPEINNEEVLVKIDMAIVNGSSYKTYLRGHSVLVNKKLPSPFGHQFVGMVAERGNTSGNFEIGDRVVSLNSAPCYKCEFCKKAKFSLCEDLLFLNGAFAEYIKIPERIVKHNLHKIPASLSFKKAALTETLAVVLHGIDRSTISPGETVCVIGTGAIGLLFTSVLKSKGINVIVLGRNVEKLKIAKKLGAEHVFNLNENYKDNIKAVTHGYGPDVVIEAVGKTEIWQLATELVKKGGMVNFFGGCEKDSKVELDTYRLHYDELRLVGVFHHTPYYVKQSIKMLESKLEKIDEILISETLTLNELEKAFELIKNKKAVQISIKL